MCGTATDNQHLKLRIAGIIQESITDGPGLRMTVFTQGCPHHCPGCHNPQTHDPAGGSWQSIAELIAIYQKNPLLDGITISGGEPFLQPRPLFFLASGIHAHGGNVITYTGYQLAELQAMSDPDIAALLNESDYIIDGPFIARLRTLEKPFCGSSNQRVLKRGQDY